jgi:hypothetical protein
MHADEDELGVRAAGLRVTKTKYHIYLVILIVTVDLDSSNSDLHCDIYRRFVD